MKENVKLSVLVKIETEESKFVKAGKTLNTETVSVKRPKRDVGGTSKKDTIQSSRISDDDGNDGVDND